MPTVIWSRAALADLDRQYQFLKSQNPEAATRALHAISVLERLGIQNVFAIAPVSSTLEGDLLKFEYTETHTISLC